MKAKLSFSAGIFVTDLLLWSLLCFSIVLGFLCADDIRQYSSISLRFDTPISGQAAYAARQYSISHSDENVFWPTYWTEYKASLSSEFITTRADCIAFSGDALLVFPAKYVSGSAPGVIDGSGCAVSEALAWRLWGNTDVAGMIVDVDGIERVIRGVFKGKDELALISFRDEDTTMSWSAVELQGGAEEVDRETVGRFATISGIGQPDYILMGALSPVAGAMALSPLLVLAVFGLSLIICYVRKRLPTGRKIIPYLLFAAFAAFLPALLGVLPGKVVPTRWSDFSFWGSLLKQTSSGLREFLRAAPRSRDVEVRMLLLRQAGIAFLAVCVSLSLCFRWKIRIIGNRE